MKKRDIEKRISDSFSHATPDVWENILSAYEEKKADIIMKNVNLNSSKSSVGKSFMWKTSFAVAGLAIATVAGVATVNFLNTPNISSTVLLDVNPSIEIDLDDKENVVEIEAKNDDGKTIIDDINVKGKDLDTALDAILDEMVAQGYINDTANSVLVSIDGDDEVKNAELKSQIAEKVNQVLTQNNISGAVVTQSIDDDVAELVTKYNISEGKAQLVENLLEANDMYKEEDLVNLTVDQLVILSSSSKNQNDDLEVNGSVNETGYIGKDAALGIALTEVEADSGAPITGNIFDQEIELDLEDGVMVYEVSFDYNTFEYEIDINAITGEAVKFEKDLLNDEDIDDNNDDDNEDDDDDDDTSSVAVEVITSEEALQIAVAEVEKDLGIQVTGELIDQTVEFDEDDNKNIYEISFEYDNYEFDIDVDAVTGEVVKFDKDLNDDIDDDKDDDQDDIDDDKDDDQDDIDDDQDDIDDDQDDIDDDQDDIDDDQDDIDDDQDDIDDDDDDQDD